MGTPDAYLVYKRDTRYLLYWMIHASNDIGKSLPSQGENHDSVGPNVTGQTTLPGLVSMSRLIAEHVNPIPSLIYRLLRSIIDARNASFSLLQYIVPNKPSPDIQKHATSHRHFINVFTKVFSILGGATWKSNRKNRNTKPDDEGTVDDIIFNKFARLSINEPSKAEVQDNDEESEQEKSPTSSRQKRQPKPGKGGKRKGRRKLRKSQASTTATQPTLDDIPLENYRIIENDKDITANYMMAIHTLWLEWTDLRHRLQSFWCEVAYKGLNSACAGQLSNLAFAMVKKTESTVFADFPGHESYETVMQTVVGRHADKDQDDFSVFPSGEQSNSTISPNVQQANVDMKEQLLVYAYRDLVDFVTDFQKTRSGKPTDSMKAQIRHWDLEFDPLHANAEQRLKWRRSYTINWLYDLVYVFSHVVMKHNAERKGRCAYESVDWSVTGPWNRHRRLFGLNEFAGFVTSLAMQKPGTDIRQKILPHHVFQLQCIVDSMTVSYGWSISGLRGHVLRPPATDFLPTRDIDRLLASRREKHMQGLLLSMKLLVDTIFPGDAELQGKPSLYKNPTELLKLVRDDLLEWLGRSKCMQYSPLLCGVGLLEGLELTYSSIMMVWDRTPEPILFFHLHNMLVQKGYITEPTVVYNAIQDMHITDLFVEGILPSSNFTEALMTRIGYAGAHRATFDRHCVGRMAVRTGVDIHETLNEDANQFFKTKPTANHYRRANWDIKRIPEEDIMTDSELARLRIARTKRWRMNGASEGDLLNMSSFLHQMSPTREPQVDIPDGIKALLNFGFENRAEATTTQDIGCEPDAEFLGSELLDILRWNIFAEVCGEWPLLGVDYVRVTVAIFTTFRCIEDELEELRNPLYTRAFESDKRFGDEKRIGLTMLALSEQEDECLKVMAKYIERWHEGTGLVKFSYWGRLEDFRQKMVNEEHVGSERIGPDGCVVM
ncbi:hypothetical protein M426DRAFT_13676 [Hypoxylon sp. CI-4A]|nr:hypothetical protein M426DRAFT_13676 [Hypoxylon sp. CI-4A]